MTGNVRTVLFAIWVLMIYIIAMWGITAHAYS